MSDNAEKAIKLFISISKGAQLYPKTHPGVLTPLNTLSEIIRELHETQNILQFGIADGRLFFEDHVFFDENSATTQLTNFLEGKNIESVGISKGFENNDLFAFLKLLSLTDPALSEVGTLRQLLEDDGISSITIKYVDEEEDINERAKKAYDDAVQHVANIFQEVRMGGIPKIENTRKVVDEIIDVIFTDHSAMLCLTMIKAYDDYTFNHSVNVSILATAIAKALELDEKTVSEIGTAGLLHDIGKTKTDKAIIKKPGKLTNSEFNEIKRHPEIGADILRKMPGLSENIVNTVFEHHIHYDKKGYPKVSADFKLHKYSTLITVADTYDAITTLRSYQAPVTPKDAIDTMIRLEDKCFEKEVLRKFIDILGVYPTGSFVRLDTNEIALVTKQNPNDPMAPTVKIVINSDGNKLIDVQEVDLSDTARNAKKRLIASAVDPAFIGINITDYI